MNTHYDVAHDSPTTACHVEWYGEGSKGDEGEIGSHRTALTQFPPIHPSISPGAPSGTFVLATDASVAADAEVVGNSRRAGVAAAATACRAESSKSWMVVPEMLRTRCCSCVSAHRLSTRLLMRLLGR